MTGIPDYMKKVVRWDQTTTQVGERQTELEFLQTHSAQLAGISAQYKELGSEYQTVSARKLELSQEMRELLRKGETLTDFIRTGIRHYYGSDAEALFAFGMVPTTRRARRTTPPPVEQTEPAPAPAK